MTTSESTTIPPIDFDPPLVSRPAVLAPASLLLAAGGVSSYFYSLTLPTVRTTAWPTFAMLALGVALGVAAVAQRRRWWTLVPTGGSVLIAAGFLHAFFIGFQLPEAQAGPGALESAPDFTLADQQGRAVSLSAYRGKGPVLLVFYRGAYCLFCRAELRGLAGIHRTLKRMGGSVLAVSIDPPATSRQMATECGVGFPILSDPELRIVDRYGMRHPKGHLGRDVALSASFLIDREGTIRWRFVSRRLQDIARPDRIAEQIAKLTTG